MAETPATTEAARLLALARERFCLDLEGLRGVPCDQCEVGRGTGEVAACPLRRTEISAIQSQLNKMARDKSEDHANWRAEYQAEPKPPATKAVVRIGAANVIEARSGLPQRIAPATAEIIVQGRDVGRNEIHTTVMAISPGRVCHVIDYYVTPVESPGGLSNRDTAEGRAIQMQIEAAIRSAIRALDASDQRTTFARPDGSRVGITLTVYDSRYGMHVVRECCYECGQHRNLPAMGMGSAKGLRQWSVPKSIESGARAPRARDRIYQTRDRNTYSRWVSIGTARANAKDRLVLSLYAHSDWYKSNVHAGFFLSAGDPGSISIFDPVDEDTGEILAGALHSRYHARYAAHITAEQEEEVVPGSSLTRWVKVKGRKANHYFDSTYLCLVAAAVVESLIAPEIGLQSESMSTIKTPPRPDGKTVQRNITQRPSQQKSTPKGKRSATKKPRQTSRSFRRSY